MFFQLALPDKPGGIRSGGKLGGCQQACLVYVPNRQRMILARFNE
jgi:hypothetical protein